MEAETGRFLKFEVSLVYTISSKTAEATEKTPVESAVLHTPRPSLPHPEFLCVALVVLDLSVEQAGHKLKNSSCLSSLQSAGIKGVSH